MHCKTRRAHAAHLLWFALSIACSDDGLGVQNQNSSTGSDEGDSGQGATTVNGDSTGIATGPAGSDGTGSSGSDVATEGDNTSATGTTSEGTGTTSDGSGSGSGEGTGTSEGTGTTDGGSTTEACMPISDDPSGIGMNCVSDLDCPDGYTCQPFVGFAFMQTCQILCENDCDCPVGLTCNETVDKTGVPWYQCG